MKYKHQRMLLIVLALAFLGASVAFTLYAFKDNMVFFFSPSELAAHPVKEGKTIRIGGLVKEGSLQKSQGGLVTRFVLTDLKAEIIVHYKGILPALFREGQGTVAHGSVKGGEFYADELLAKHDENYMPPEVAKALKQSGHWKAKP